MTEIFDFADGEVIEMWTTRRLPYIDRQTTGERAAVERLRHSLRLLPDDQSTILSARYTSSHDGSFDVENVLAYNVGMSAFRGAARRGMIFERVRATPPAAPSGSLYDHHHAYKLIPAPPRPIDGTTITFDLPSICNVDNVWWAVTSSPPITYAAITGRFSLHVEVGLTGRASLPGTLKKLLDGIVAGLQADPDPDAEAVRCLSQRMSLSGNLVAGHLTAPANAVLGLRPRLLFARRSSVQWNPGDDKCESVTVVATNTPGACTATVTDLS
ncbi:hypothetical protein [Paraburkholderia caffeinilytica]|uniref:hypothetical protein n=1 Tax=Paraburkholderia caffeinilytica TaxID=1761016 RepID=UPI003DA0A443